MTSYLIVKTSAIGDIVLALAVLPYLAKKGEVDWVIEEKFASLLEGNEYIRNVIPVNRKQWWQFPRKETYDAIFDLQGNCKSALFTLMTRSSVKVGFKRDAVAEWPNLLVTNRKFPIDQTKPMQQQYLDLVASYFGEEVQVTLPEKISQSKTIMVCTGSNWENKKVALETWITFLKKLDRKLIFIWGSEKEKIQVTHIAHQVGGNCEVFGDLSFSLWRAKMEECGGVISVDSCALHLAAACGVPTFSIFGPSNQTIYAPVGAIHAHMQGECPYKEGFEKRCSKLRTCPTGLCIKAISAESIYRAFTAWQEDLSLRLADQNRCETRLAQSLPQL